MTPGDDQRNGTQGADAREPRWQRGVISDAARAAKQPATSLLQGQTRPRRTRSVASVPIDEGTQVMAQDDNAAAESSHDVRKLLGRLPEKVRCSIECVKLEGRSVAEAAVRCGISESGVKINIHRGLRALATFIARETKNENG